MASTKGPAPDPVAVLRGHRAAVNVVAFHQPSATLLSGDADGDLKIWDLVRHRPLSSSRVHSPAAGVIGIGVCNALGYRVLSQGRDGTVKCWQLTESSLSRQPLLTIKTEAYHFCKLSLATTKIEPEGDDVLEFTSPQQSAHLQSPFLEDDMTHTEMSERNSKTPCSDTGAQTQADDKLASATETVGVGNASIGRGRVLMAIAGKEPSAVEMWDLDAGKCAQQLTSSSSSGMCMALQAFVQPEAQGVCMVVAGYEDGTMSVWDMRNVAAPLLQARLHTEPVLSIAMDGAGVGGVSGSADSNTVFFVLDYQVNKCVVKKQFSGQPGIGDIAIRNDDKLVATAGWDHRYADHGDLVFMYALVSEGSH